jgi:hypothetical protein
MKFIQGGTFSQPVYQALVIGVCGGFVWKGDNYGNVAKAVNGQSTALLSGTSQCSLCYLSTPSHPNAVYIADGINSLVRYDLNTDTVQYHEHLVSPATLPTPALTLSNTAGGTFPSTTYYVQIGYYKDTTGEMTLSGLASSTIAANHLLVVNSPATATGCTNYYVYVSESSTAGSGILQAIVPIGTNWTEPTSGLIAGPVPPTGTFPPPCSLCCNWRGRLVLAGDSANPQNYYMMRQNETLDADYSQEDPAAAFAGQLGTIGQIGEPITALVPFSDDILKICSSHSMSMCQGDPTEGSISVVSKNMGILGKDAWAVAPDGTLYFVATGGLYAVRPLWEFYRPPEPITTNNYNQFFAALNPSKQTVSLVYDADLHYLHVFAANTDGSAGTHLTVDARTIGQDGGPGLWPQQFSSTAAAGPAILYLGDANPTNRAVLLFGTDGYIRKWSQSATDDDGTAINSYVFLGPWAPLPGQASVINGVTLDLGEVPAGVSSTLWNVQATLYAGASAYDVTEGVAGNLHSFSSVQLTLDRRQKTFRQRLRGGWFSLKLSNAVDNDLFALESGVIDFVPGGPNRLRR